MTNDKYGIDSVKVDMVKIGGNFDGGKSNAPMTLNNYSSTSSSQMYTNQNGGYTS